MVFQTHSSAGTLPPRGGRDRTVAAWLWLCAALVLAMVVVGGATRLTDSGLSITEWQPLLGAIPPLSEADWQAAFQKYQQIPEYHLVNKGMTLEAFKGIYWWEWGHRLLGRLIGVAVAVPALLFWLRGRLRAGLPLKLLGVFALGGLQGAIGWYMVKSGLADRVDVSQYRLALHLTTALTIFALLVWLARDESDAGSVRAADRPSRAVRRMARLTLALIAVQLILGAFVAGLKAGLVYNTWPLMDGHVVPPDYWSATSPALSFFESHAAAQFNHRVMAYIVAVAALIQFGLAARDDAVLRIRITAAVLAAGVAAQIALGVATLLGHVPLTLGLLHQAGGALVLALAVLHLYETRRARTLGAA